MMRLQAPEFSDQDTVGACREGITGNSDLLTRVTNGEIHLLGLGANYAERAGIGKLYEIAAIDRTQDDDPVVVGALKRSDLMTLYDYYMVTEVKPARKVYDSLMNAARERCPYCGGIGRPRNLDHYLPKSHFPQFSILPRNLVPCCRDCNMDGDVDSFSENEQDQIIHPYLDKNLFFLEQWIFGRYNQGEAGSPGDIEYFVQAPNNWTDIDKHRVSCHFDVFGLATRYATKAAEQLGIVLRQVERMKESANPIEQIRQDLLQPGIDKAIFPNHWTKGMYQALMAAEL